MRRIGRRFCRRCAAWCAALFPSENGSRQPSARGVGVSTWHVGGAVGGRLWRGGGRKGAGEWDGSDEYVGQRGGEESRANAQILVPIGIEFCAFGESREWGLDCGGARAVGKDAKPCRGRTGICVYVGRAQIAALAIGATENATRTSGKRKTAGGALGAHRPSSGLRGKYATAQKPGTLGSSARASSTCPWLYSWSASLPAR